MYGLKQAACGAMCAALCLPAAARAAIYDARLRLQPPAEPSVAGYVVYVRKAGEEYGEVRDVGLPTPAPDGSLSVHLRGLEVRATYYLAAASYTASRLESGLSNELGIGYVNVASVVDSDGDGLTDATEDVNLNQVVDIGETDPENPDTDGDGAPDGDDVCRGTPSDTAVDTDGCPFCLELQVRKMAFRAARKEYVLRGRGTIVGLPAFDPVSADLTFELTDAAGASFYRAEVPGAAFRTARRGRILRFVDDPQDSTSSPGTNGLQAVILKARGGELIVTMRAVVSSAPDALEVPSIAWMIQAGNVCARKANLNCAARSPLLIRCR
jgi:hypothetical protein